MVFCVFIFATMNYCIDISAEEPIMLINHHIGYDKDDGMGIDGAEFQKELLQLDTMGKKRIQVWINSPGGIVTDGYSIYNAILKSKTPVDTYAIGACASIAAVIFQAGRKRIMSDYAWLMYHNPFGIDNKDVINIMTESIITMISERSGITKEDVAAMMKRTSFIGADEAKQMKLCDEIDSSKTENTKYLRTIKDTMQYHNECNKVLNTILNKPKKMNELKLVTNKLGLNSSATEESILDAIVAIENNAKSEIANLKAELEKVQNKAKADDDEMDKLKAKLKKAEADKAKADEDYNACKSLLDAMEADKAKAEEDAKVEKAKNMIEDFAKSGRIKNEEVVKLEWLEVANKLGFDKCKNMIESIELNKKAEKVDVVINKGVDMPTNAINLMAANRLKREQKNIK